MVVNFAKFFLMLGCQTPTNKFYFFLSIVTNERDCVSHEARTFFLGSSSSCGVRDAKRELSTLVVVNIVRCEARSANLMCWLL